MCKQIRHTYYCKELFLVKHKTKHSCKSAIFHTLTSDVVYSVCKFDYYYNTTVPPSVLDGGSHKLLANMLNHKRLVCSENLHMAQPIPNHPYVLVNRSILCNCHLQSGLTYLLKSLGSCDPGTILTMYFTINGAFQHYISPSDLSNDQYDPNSLLPRKHIFDIFLNDTYPTHHLSGKHLTMKSLGPPSTLQALFQSMSTRTHTSQNSPFFPIEQQTMGKILPNSTKDSFLFSTMAHIIYFSASCILACLLAPQIYLACKHKKLSTLVTAMTLQRLPHTEAMSAFKLPQNKEAKIICQDPWVSIAAIIITILDVIIYLYRVCSKMTFLKAICMIMCAQHICLSAKIATT